MSSISLNKFKEDLILQGVSDKTLYQYCIYLKKLPVGLEEQRRYIVQHPKNYNLIKAYRRYLKFVRRKGDLTFEELYELLDTFKLPSKRGSHGKKRSGIAIPRREWAKIIDKAPHEQAAVFLFIGFKAALRPGELRHLRVNDVNFEKRVFHIREREANPKINQIKWSPKFEKERDVPFDDDVVSTLRTWISEIRPKNLGHPYLVWNPHGNAKPGRVSANSLYKWVKKTHSLLKPHDLRRSCITEASNLMDIKIISKVAGHEEIKTTQDYILQEEEEVFEIFRKAMS